MKMHLTGTLGPQGAAPFVIRVASGFYLLLLGIWGFTEPELSLKAVNEYSGFTGPSLHLYFEIARVAFFAAGSLLILGFLTLCASTIACLVIAVLLYSGGAFNPSGDELSYFIAQRSLYRDTVVFAACLSLVFSGPGILSLDSVLSKIYATK